MIVKVQTLIASIIVFGLIIFVHELGHYIAARLSGIKVLELALGFGPRLIGWSRGGTDYSLRIIPFGGFCRMLGEDPSEKDHPGNFTEKPLLSRIAVVVAGPLMNFVLALLLLFSVYFFFVGVPITDSTGIGNVVPGHPAAEAGLQTGDQLTAIDGVNVSNWNDVVSLIEDKEGRQVELAFIRDGKQNVISITPIAEETPEGTRGVIGITPRVEKFVFGGAINSSFQYISFVLVATYQTLTGKVPLEVVGPVGIISFVGQAANNGIVSLMLLTALISFSLCIMNLLPIPALDGGRLLFLLIEGIRRRPLDPEKEGFIHMIGFAILIILILLITYNDLIRLDIFR
ncbi:MAG: RIP metalloprotease RseP [Dethiobacteria bacterium]